ncbi:hypothetical protein BX666DRAFT_2022771 [Dichotomocladium elegans]|nr:hypothetical protein BX666DRAFT_2022771 [Dichotomocladium elegans]
MNDRWTRFYGSVQGTTVVSFCLGMTGSALGATLLQHQFRTAMAEQMMQCRDIMLNMRRRLEIAGGVPYLLRDEAFVAYWGNLPRPRYLTRQDRFRAAKHYVQHLWNCGIITTAATLNRHLAKRYEPPSRRCPPAVTSTSIVTEK